VSEFAQKIGEIQTACKNSTTSDAVYALNLYRYIATNAQESDNSVCSLYETVTSGSGTVDSYSKLFEYLLLQAGIEAHHVICEDEDNVSTGISLVKLGDEEFYFSPMLEYLDNKGKSLKYFGMSTIDAELYGLTAFAYTNQEYIDELEFNKFDDCRKAKSYNIDGTTMFVTENDGTVVEIYL
jgi:hypothetical protein